MTTTQTQHNDNLRFWNYTHIDTESHAILPKLLPQACTCFTESKKLLQAHNIVNSTQYTNIYSLNAYLVQMSPGTVTPTQKEQQKWQSQSIKNGTVNHTGSSSGFLCEPRKRHSHRYHAISLSNEVLYRGIKRKRLYV